MQYGKVTRIMVREDRPTAISSRLYGANVDAVGFNLVFIAERKPALAVELMRLYYEAWKIEESDSLAPAKESNLASEQLNKLMIKNSKDKI